MDLKEHLLSRGTIRLQVQVDDWRDAVKAGTDLLVAAGTVQPRYYDEIVRSVDELGPYFLLAPGLAMPHARPEHGVLETSFALVTLKTPVCFGDPDNDPVDVLLTLAARDAETQNKTAMVQVAALFDSEEAVALLRRAACDEDVARAFDCVTVEEL